MLKRLYILLFGLAFSALASAQAAEPWEAGKQYFVIEPPQPTSTGDKIEVLEVFSYACPACNVFQVTMRKLAAALPENAEIAYMPASFRSDEDWPMFQRAFFTLQALGILDKAHEATFDAVWKDDGALRISDPKTHRPLKPMPSLEDAARFYTRFGVSAEDFLGVANSFAVNTRIRRADQQMKAYGIESTPTIIVNGRYRLTGVSAGSFENIVPLVQYLIAKDSAAR